MHGGECKEICDPKDARFSIHARALQTTLISDAKPDVTKAACKLFNLASVIKSGIYAIYEVEKSASFYVYCDMESDDKRVWTLIQSFAFEQRTYLSEKGFGVDLPVGENQTNVEWTFHRLSLSHMK